MEERRRKKLSKYLSKVLRHDPGRVGLELGPGGWVNMAELLEAFRRHGVRISLDDILEAIAEGKKPRFTVEPLDAPAAGREGSDVDEGERGGAARRLLTATGRQPDPSRLRIRANYGHSIPVDLDLTPQPPPELLYHGTAEQTVKRVLQEGLKSMGRQFVHLYQEPDGAMEVGRRHGRPVLLAVRSGEMQAAGWSFYPAGGGIWLTERVPAEMLRTAREA
jgi:putative RNA 2'-phosphotransferase